MCVDSSEPSPKDRASEGTSQFPTRDETKDLKAGFDKQATLADDPSITIPVESIASGTLNLWVLPDHRIDSGGSGFRIMVKESAELAALLNSPEVRDRAEKEHRIHVMGFWILRTVNGEHKTPGDPIVASDLERSEGPSPTGRAEGLNYPSGLHRAEDRWVGDLPKCVLRYTAIAGDPPELINNSGGRLSIKGSLTEEAEAWLNLQSLKTLGVKHDPTLKPFGWKPLRFLADGQVLELTVPYPYARASQLAGGRAILSPAGSNKSGRPRDDAKYEKIKGLRSRQPPVLWPKVAKMHGYANGTSAKKSLKAMAQRRGEDPTPYL